MSLQIFCSAFGLLDVTVVLVTGLTILAMCNSLADLSKTDMSMAGVFPQIMGFSTCFSMHMVEFFLGIGIAGSYAILQAGGELCILYG